MSGVHGQEKAGTTLLKKMACVFKSKQPEPEPEHSSGPMMPQNSLDSPQDGITPTGKRLQPFGQPNYWGGIPIDSGEDEMLGLLPPLPDLRTPDQITDVEKRRIAKNARFAARQAQNEAQHQARLLEKKPEVTTPPPDPSTALIQVESQQLTANDYGRRERPNAVLGGKLKPFNANSTFIENGEVKYKWSNHQFVEPPQDDSHELGMLPPLPDLRTPDQVTDIEKRRNLRNLKFQARQAREDAQREAVREARQPTLEPWEKKHSY